MTDFYEILPLCNQLDQLARQRGIALEATPGNRMCFEGQLYRVLFERGNAVALVDDLASLPVDPSAMLYIEDWQEHPHCVSIPSVEDLLYLIRETTSLFPTLTPGVQATREVWQIQHPSIDPIVDAPLLQALLQAALRILEQNPSSQQAQKGWER